MTKAMMLEEFEQRTGIYPPPELYRVIEQFYSEFDGDKDAFCKAYKENDGWLAEKIQRAATVARCSEERQAETVRQEYETRIAKLEAALDRELEWEPYIDAHNVSRADYENLVGASDTRYLTVEEAKDLLYGWYGFAKEKLTIHTEIPKYEVNRHGNLRKVGAIDRKPAYNATDWNYIRFDCGCITYELHNGNLRFYVH